MKLSAPLIGIASAVALAGSALSAAPGQHHTLAPPTTAMPSPGRWTTQNVSTERPFGDIDVSPAGSSVQSVRLWSLGRSVLQRYEINGRCAVITTPANAARYSDSDRQFCQNYRLAGFARPVTPRS